MIRPVSTSNWSSAQLRTPTAAWTRTLTHVGVSTTSEHLVEGFESAYGLELLATVHWVVIQEKAKTLADVVDHTYAWNDRKKRFSPRQIKIACETLAGEGWFSNF